MRRRRLRRRGCGQARPCRQGTCTSRRRSFAKADMNSSEADDLSQLEEQAKLAQDALFRRKKELQRLQTDYEEDQRRLEQVAQQGARLEERNAHLGEAKTQTLEEANDAKIETLHGRTRARPSWRSK